MRIIFYTQGGDTEAWLNSFSEIMPDTEVYLWQPGDNLMNSPS